MGSVYQVLKLLVWWTITNERTIDALDNGSKCNGSVTVTDMSRARKFNDTRIFNHHGRFYKGALLLKRTNEKLDLTSL